MGNNVFGKDFVDICVDKWNLLPIENIKHKKGTKTFHEIASYIEQLRNGTFGEKKYLAVKFFSKLQIPVENLNRKYSKEEILEAIGNLKYLFMDGYFPPNKGRLSKNLLFLIYNRVYGTSYLMFCLTYRNPVPAKRMIIDLKLTEVYGDVFEYLKQSGTFQENFDKLEAAKGVKSIAGFVKNIKPMYLRVPKIKREFGDIQLVMENFINWLKEQSWIKKPVSIKVLNANSKAFIMFVKHCESGYDGITLM